MKTHRSRQSARIVSTSLIALILLMGVAAGCDAGKASHVSTTSADTRSPSVSVSNEGTVAPPMPRPTFLVFYYFVTGTCSPQFELTNEGTEDKVVTLEYDGVAAPNGTIVVAAGSTETITFDTDYPSSIRVIDTTGAYIGGHILPKDCQPAT